MTIRLRPRWMLSCCAVLLLVLLQPAWGEEEPVYQGRTVSSWLQDFAMGRFPDMDKHRLAVKAIRAIGKEALPVLVDRLKVTSASLDAVQDMHTLSAFTALGSEASPAVPDLIKLLAPAYDAARLSPSEPDAMLKHRKSIYAALSLRAIGENSVVPLTRALASEEKQIRFGAAMAMEHLRHREQVVVLALIRALDDEDDSVRWRAARSLGALHAMPELSVPALSKRVREDPAANVRWYAISALAKFGPAAQSAVPDLLKATTDASSAVRLRAREARQKIDPSAATEVEDRKP